MFVVPIGSIELVDRREHRGVNTGIGDPVAAIDPESTELAYSLAGADSDLFAIACIERSDQCWSRRRRTGLRVPIRL